MGKIIAAVATAILLCLACNLHRCSQWLAFFLDLDDAPTVVSSTPIAQYDFIHLYNPHQVTNCNVSFCPFDQAQSLAIASMIRAKNKAADHYNITVALAATAFATEVSIIPDDFHKLPSLTRSTATVYPELSIQGTKRALPFIQDILDSLKHAQGSLHSNYVVYTNSDIILHEDFYQVVHTQIQKGHQTFTINRQTVLGHDYLKATTKELDVLFQLKGKNVQEHPGYDCFVFSYDDILHKMDLGNVFVGYPPVGLALVAQLMTHGGDTFRRFRTPQLRTTYHIGNDKIWRLKVGEEESEHVLYNELNKVNADALAISWRAMLGNHRPNSVQTRESLSI